MRQIAILALFAILLFAENSAEISGENLAEISSENSVQISSENANLSQISSENSSQNANSVQNSTENSSQSPNFTTHLREIFSEDSSEIDYSQKGQKYDFNEIAMQEFRGESHTINILRIKTHELNYFSPFSYAFNHSYRETYPKKDFREGEAKFQLSIKKAIFEDLFGSKISLNFGYTQTAWWQLYADSAPFRELNYAPEVFLSRTFEHTGSLKNISIGFLHQSNGKDDENMESRSWNRAYFKLTYKIGRVAIQPRIWYIVPESSLEGNRDIAKYLGYFDAKITYLGKDVFVQATLRNSLRFPHNRGAIELNAGYDLFDNGILWFVQYFNGYGESLIEYQKHINKLSVGILVAY